MTGDPVGSSTAQPSKPIFVSAQAPNSIAVTPGEPIRKYQLSQSPFPRKSHRDQAH